MSKWKYFLFSSLIFFAFSSCKQEDPVEVVTLQKLQVEEKTFEHREVTYMLEFKNFSTEEHYSVSSLTCEVYSHDGEMLAFLVPPSKKIVISPNSKIRSVFTSRVRVMDRVTDGWEKYKCNFVSEEVDKLKEVKSGFEDQSKSNEKSCAKSCPQCYNAGSCNMDCVGNTDTCSKEELKR